LDMGGGDDQGGVSEKMLFGILFGGPSRLGNTARRAWGVGGRLGIVGRGPPPVPRRGRAKPGPRAPAEKPFFLMGEKGGHSPLWARLGKPGRSGGGKRFGTKVFAKGPRALRGVAVNVKKTNPSGRSGFRILHPGGGGDLWVG